MPLQNSCIETQQCARIKKQDFRRWLKDGGGTLVNGFKSFVMEVSHNIELPCPFTFDMLECHSKVLSQKQRSASLSSVVKFLSFLDYLVCSISLQQHKTDWNNPSVL